MQRLDDALLRIEAALRLREAEMRHREVEIARLRKIEMAATSALADLDVLLGERGSQRKYG